MAEEVADSPDTTDDDAEVEEEVREMEVGSGIFVMNSVFII